MLADTLLARAFARARVLPEASLEAALAAALEATDGWTRMVRHFGWDLPATRPRVSTQDHVEKGRSDIRLTFPDGRLVVLELKAGPAPTLHQMYKYADGAVVIGIATSPRVYPTPQLVGSTTWGDLRNLPWIDPPLPWRQLVHLADAVGVTMPPVDAAALTGLLASYAAVDTFTTWTQHAADDVAAALNKGGATFGTREKKGGHRFDERAHRRQVSWTWPRPWKSHPFAGIINGLFFGRPEVPVLAAGLPDLMLTWQCKPGEPLHLALAEDTRLAAAARQWAARPNNGTLRLWLPGNWALIHARRSSAALLGQPEADKTYLDWVGQLLSEWEEDGISDRLRAHLAPTGTPAFDDDDGPASEGPPVGPVENEA